MAEDPSTEAEKPEPTEDKVEIDKSRFDRLSKLEATEGYAVRQAEKRAKDAEAKFQELLNAPPEEDGETKTRVFQAVKQTQEAEAKLAAATAKENEVKALELAMEFRDKYGLDAKELAVKFADCSSEAEMKSIGFEIALNAKPSPSRSAVDMGSGGSGVVTSKTFADKQKAFVAGERSWDEYQKDCQEAGKL